MNNNKPVNLIFFGRSGSGKGTQAELLAKHLGNTLHVATGDLMRDLSKQDTDAGRRIKKVLDEGGLPFDAMATTLWMHKMAYTLKDDQNLICDGFPRRSDEARDLFEFLTWLERIDNAKALVIEISREEAMKRLLLRARHDDDKDAISKRLDWYEDRVVPAINFFKGKGLVVEINGEQPIEKVFEDILEKLNEQN
ncbi:MAG: nucleoside monophosphate kinase [Candidatus Yanofskybacteria bacterium]|nr:nucleoside monophosphate kinase [Candidatus Yanofskybacteria bacterium]